MKISKLKVNTNSNKYSIIIGSGIINKLSKILNLISSTSFALPPAKQSTENRKNRIFSNTFFILKKCAIIYKI